ncbi:transcriptional regulator, partial [Candidatus Bathyarchaeota archaeon]|nr:transcriptional regulator [Candidatus Bathyarchaeota archaeon]
YVEGPWLYSYISRGNINAFWGEEEIQYDGIKVYGLRFHGGEIET